MPANKNKPLLERAKTVIRGLLRVESRKATDGGTKSLSAIEQALTSFAERLYIALAPRVRSENPFVGDLKEVDRLARLKGDQIDHEIIKIERSFVRKYMRVYSYYKIDSLVHQFTSYYRLEVPRADSSSEVRLMYREISENLRSSLEAAHASLLNDIRLSIESSEKKYLARIADSFASAIRCKYEELSKRAKDNAKAGLPSGWGFGTNYEAAHKKKSSSAKGPKYENATLQNRKQKNFSGLGEKQRNPDIAKDSVEPQRAKENGEEYEKKATEKKFDTTNAGQNHGQNDSLMNGESSGGSKNTRNESRENSSSGAEDRRTADPKKKLGSGANEGAVSKRSAFDGIADSIMEDGKSNCSGEEPKNNRSQGRSGAPENSKIGADKDGTAENNPPTDAQSDNLGKPHANSLSDAADGSSADERPEPNLNFGAADEGVPVLELFDSEDGAEGVGIAESEPGSEYKPTGMFALGKDSGRKEAETEDCSEISSASSISADADSDGDFDGDSLPEANGPSGSGAGGNLQDMSGIARDAMQSDASVSESDAASAVFWPDEYYLTQRYAPENFGTFVGGYAGRRPYDVNDFDAIPKSPERLSDQDKKNTKSSPEKSEAEKEFDAYFADLAESVLKGKPPMSMFSNPGNDEGTALEGDTDAFTKCLTAIDRSPGLKRLLDQLGSGMGLSSPSAEVSIGREPERKITGVPENISGITLGNEIEHLLPQEIVNLSVPGMDALFAMRYAERGLMRFDVEGMAGIDARGRGHKSSSPKGRGPVVMCVDTSSSMRSGSDILAKATVLSLAGKCLSSGRDCYVINFSVSIEKMLLRAGDANSEEKLKKFLSKSFDGGSDLDQALMECLSIMRNDSAFFRSDVLCLTDGQIKFSVPLEQAVQRHRQKEKNKFFEVVIGAFANESYWIDARQRLREQASLFDRLFELSRDGMRLREITEIDYA